MKGDLLKPFCQTCSRERRLLWHVRILLTLNSYFAVQVLAALRLLTQSGKLFHYYYPSMILQCLRTAAQKEKLLKVNFYRIKTRNIWFFPQKQLPKPKNKQLEEPTSLWAKYTFDRNQCCLAMPDSHPPSFLLSALMFVKSWILPNSPKSPTVLSSARNSSKIHFSE